MGFSSGDVLTACEVEFHCTTSSIPKGVHLGGGGGGVNILLSCQHFSVFWFLKSTSTCIPWLHSSFLIETAESSSVYPNCLGTNLSAVHYILPLAWNAVEFLWGTNIQQPSLCNQLSGLCILGLNPGQGQWAWHFTLAVLQSTRLYMYAWKWVLPVGLVCRLTDCNQGSAGVIFG